MKNNTLLFSFVALLAIVFTLSSVAAQIADINLVKINDIPTTTTGITVAGEVSDSVPVEVFFTANGDVNDVKVKTYIEGYKSQISDETPLFHIVNGSTYVKRFTLTLPNAMDLSNEPEKLTLYVRITAKGEDPVEVPYTISMQKTQYGIQILSIDSPDATTAGSTIAVNVVLKNLGSERMNDLYVKASIPELGIARIIYAGDLNEIQQDNLESIRNSVEKQIFLAIPKTAAPGNYNIQIEAYNYDSSTTAKTRLVVAGTDTGVIPSVTTKTVAIGEEATYDVVLVNQDSKMVVYTLTPQESKGLTITLDQPVVAVQGQSSQTVKVTVKATDSADQGTHVVTVNVNSDTGVAKQVSFTANVEKASTSTTTGTTATPASNTVLILTVVLSIIFVVLLIVLIVLLTRKPAESVVFGETSYY